MSPSSASHDTLPRPQLVEVIAMQPHTIGPSVD
jgi:hypothetical protein